MNASNHTPASWQGAPIPFDAPMEELRERILTPGVAAWTAFLALANRDSDEALNALDAATRSHDASLRRAAVEALGLHPRGRTRAAAVEERLHDSNEHVVRAACAAAGALGLAETHDAVRNLLAHPAAATRAAALDTLGTLWTPEDFEPVFRLSRKDRSRNVREEAAWVLRAHPEQANWRALFEAWHRDDMPRHRIWACELAEHFADAEPPPALEQLLSDPDGHVRDAAHRALAAQRGPLNG